MAEGFGQLAETESASVCTWGFFPVHPMCLLSIPHPSGMSLGQGAGLGQDMGELGTGSLPSSVSIVVTGEGLEWQLLIAEEKLCLLGSIPLQGRAVVSCHGVLDQTRASTTAAHTVPHCCVGVALPSVLLCPVLSHLCPAHSPGTWSRQRTAWKRSNSRCGKKLFLCFSSVKIIM